MTQTTYSDPTVASIISQHFVPVIVDADHRPDIAERYNFGGFPTTAFLTPTGDVITGGTYAEPNQMIGLLNKVREVYQKKTTAVKARVEQAGKWVERQTKRLTEASGAISDTIIWDMAQSLVTNFDPQFGGFGRSTKFPYPEAMELGLLLYNDTYDRGYLLVVSKTLQKMSTEGLFDAVEGGFFQYAENRDWKLPHNEKLLDNNASLLRSYIHAFQLTGEQSYKEVADRIIGFCQTKLFDGSTGVFHGSQASDDKYYELSAEERAKRQQPVTDTTVYTNWNAMMATSLIEAANAFGEKKHLDTAVKTIEFLLTHCREETGGMFHYYDGKPHIQGMLTDQVHTMASLVSLFQSTFETKYLTHAQELMDFCSKTLADQEHGGFFDKRLEPEAFGYLKLRDKSILENSVMARAIHQMSTLLQVEHTDLTRRTLEAFAQSYRRFGYLACDYAVATHQLLSPAVEVFVVGTNKDAATAELLNQSRRVYEPRKLLRLLDPESNKEEIAKLALKWDGKPVAYIRSGELVSQPIDDAHKIAETIREVSRKTSSIR